MAFHSLFVHELVHLTLSISATLVVCYLASREKKKIRRELYMLAFLGAILGGFFVDVDHLIDYVFAFGLDFHFGYFFSGAMFDKLQKIHVYFHAWEWVVLLGFTAYKIRSLRIKYFLMALALGLLTHLIYDTIYNNVHFLGYSILYRTIHGFDMNAIIEH